MSRAPGNVPSAASTAAARHFWLGACAIVLLLCAVILAIRAMQAERASLARIQEQLAAAADALEMQRLVAAARRADANATSAIAALVEQRRRATTDAREATALDGVLRAAAALAATGGTALGPAAPAAGGATSVVAAPASTARDPASAIAALEAATAAYATLVRERSADAVARTRDDGRLSQAGLIAASLITVVLGIMLGVVAWRTLAANQRLVGQLGQMVHEDALTGVLNRRALDENLPTELARAGRLSYPISVVMLDLDHFKRFNDRRGHGAGDVLLRAAAQSWLKQLRPTDLLARYGGEEFTLVLPACDATQAEALVDRLRPHMPERQTFSAGVATWNGSETHEELLRAADLALLQAKRGGRNRTVVAGREPQISLPLETKREQQVISSA